MAEKLGAKQLKAVASPERLNLAVPNLSKFDRLSRSLDEFGDNVTGLAVKAHNDAAEKARKQGAEAAAKAIAAGRDTEDQMVEDGVIERGEHSFFRDGALEQMGRAHAANFSNAIIIEAAEQGLAESINPEDMGKVIAKVSEEFHGNDQGAAFNAGFAAEAADVALGFEQRHAAQVAANIESGHNNEVTDKYRARALLSIEGADPSVIIDNLSEALQLESELHLGVIPDAGRADFRRSNRALTDTLITLIDDGSITGDQALEVLKKLHTPSGSLFAMAEHAPRINAAIDAAITRDTSRDANEDRIRLQAKQRRAIDVSEEMYATADANGVLSMDAVNRVMNETKGEGLTAAFVERARRSVLNSEAMAAREYHSDPTMLAEYKMRIIDGEPITTQMLSDDTHDTGGLNTSDALALWNMQQDRDVRLASNPTEAAMDSAARFMVKEGVGGFSGTEFGQQAWLRASVPFQEAFNAMRIEHPEWTAAAPEFRKWVVNTVEELQKAHLSRPEWEPLQRGADLRTAIHETAIYQDQLFDRSELNTINRYAQALEWQENGRFPDEALIEWFNEGARYLPEESHTSTNYVVALEGQLLQMGVDVKDDRIVQARNILNTRVRAGSEGGSSTAAPVRIKPENTPGNTVVSGGVESLSPEQLMELVRVADSAVAANADEGDGAGDED
jgi:hypothetical protein